VPGKRVEEGRGIEDCGPTPWPVKKDEDRHRQKRSWKPGEERHGKQPKKYVSPEAKTPHWGRQSFWDRAFMKVKRVLVKKRELGGARREIPHIGGRA